MKKMEIVKSNQLISSRTLMEKQLIALTPNGHDAINFFIYIIQNFIKIEGEQPKLSDLPPNLDISIKEQELMKGLAISKGRAYAKIEGTWEDGQPMNFLDGIVRQVFDISIEARNIPIVARHPDGSIIKDIEGSVVLQPFDRVKFRVLNSIGKRKEGREAIYFFSFNSLFMSVLMRDYHSQVGNFTKLKIEKIKKARGTNAKRVYELLEANLYKGRFSIKVSELKEILALPSEETKRVTEVLKRAQASLRELIDFEFCLKKDQYYISFPQNLFSTKETK